MDKVALVTGGSKGIGYACAERLLAEGYEVAFCARNQAEIESAAAGLGLSESRIGRGPAILPGAVAGAGSRAGGLLDRGGSGRG